MNAAAARAAARLRPLLLLPSLQLRPSTQPLNSHQSCRSLHPSATSFFSSRREAGLTSAGAAAAPLPIPSASACRSLYRQLLRSVEQFEDDLCRHVLRHRIRHSFRAHRLQHRRQHERETRLLHERKHAVLLVRDRVRWMTATPRPPSHERYRPPAALLRPPPLSLPEPLVVDSSTAVVSPELRLRIRARFDFAQSSLCLLQQALSAHRSSRIAVLSFCYTAPSLVSTIMRCRHLHRFMPHLLPPSALAAFHPLHRFLITDCQDGDWVSVYRLLVAERCRGLDSAWLPLYRQVMAKRAVPAAVFEGDRQRIREKEDTTATSRATTGGDEDDGGGDEAGEGGDTTATGMEDELLLRRGRQRGGGRGREGGGERGEQRAGQRRRRVRPSRHFPVDGQQRATRIK